MRRSVLAPMVVVAATLTMPAPAAQAAVCNVVQPFSRSTTAGVVPDGSVTFTSGDLGSTSTKLVAAIRVLNLGDPVASVTPVTRRWAFTFVDDDIPYVMETLTAGAPSGPTTFAQVRRAGVVVAPATAVFDFANSEVRLSVSLAAPGLLLGVGTNLTQQAAFTEWNGSPFDNGRDPTQITSHVIGFTQSCVNVN